MSPAFPSAARAAVPCPLSGSFRLTISRDQVVELRLSGGTLTGYTVLGVLVRVVCDGCREVLYEEMDRGAGVDVQVQRRHVPAQEPSEARGRFYLLEID